MGDARGAGGDGDDVVAVGDTRGSSLLHALLGLLLGLGLGLLGSGLGALGLVDHREELLRRLGGAQVVAEPLVHEQHGQAGEHLEVNVSLGVRRGDEEHQVRGLAVRGVVVDAVGQGHRGQAGRGDGSGLGVRDRDALAKRRGALGLAGADGGLVALDVGDVALLAHEGDELVDGVVLAGCETPNLDGLRLEQIFDSHASYLSLTGAGPC